MQHIHIFLCQEVTVFAYCSGTFEFHAEEMARREDESSSPKVTNTSPRVLPCLCMYIVIAKFCSGEVCSCFLYDKQISHAAPLFPQLSKLDISGPTKTQGALFAEVGELEAATADEDPSADAEVEQKAMKRVSSYRVLPSVYV